MRSHGSALLICLSGLLPVSIMTAFMLVNGYRLRSGMPALMLGQHAIAFAIVAGEILILCAVHGIALRVIVVILYPVLAYVCLIVYMMLFGALLFPDFPW